MSETEGAGDATLALLFTAELLEAAAGWARGAGACFGAAPPGPPFGAPAATIAPEGEKCQAQEATTARTRCVRGASRLQRGTPWPHPQLVSPQQAAHYVECHCVTCDACLVAVVWCCCRCCCCSCLLLLSLLLLLLQLLSLLLLLALRFFILPALSYPPAVTVKRTIA